MKRKPGDHSNADGKRPSGNLVTIAGCILLVIATLIALRFVGSRNASSDSAYSFEIVHTYPHDPKAFCQGLDFDGKTLFESTGKYGQSTVRRVNLDTGKPETLLQLDQRLFGEGLTLFRDKVFQITWKRGLGYVYEAETLKPISTFQYKGEGWGLTHDGENLIMSDGSDTLKFLAPDSFSVIKTVRVKDGESPVRRLNELEFVKGQVLANVWQTNRIAMIDPATGKVTDWINLTDLLPNRSSREDVLNGIAYEEASDRLFVTGKNWPKLFEIKLVKK